MTVIHQPQGLMKFEFYCMIKSPYVTLNFQGSDQFQYRTTLRLSQVTLMGLRD